MIDLSLQQYVLRLCAILVIAPVHGAAIAATARALGDQGPQHDGRLTLNPLVHLDILGTISGVLFAIGWIKPIAIDPAASWFWCSRRVPPHYRYPNGRKNRDP